MAGAVSAPSGSDTTANRPKGWRHMGNDRPKILALFARSAANSASKARPLPGDLDGACVPDPCDWAERAWPWRRPLAHANHGDVSSPLAIGAGFQLFHDANDPKISLRQEPAPEPASGPAFQIVLDLNRFDGSFLSLVHDLPHGGLSHLSLGHFFAVQVVMDHDHDIPVYGRLNIQHGPNQAQIVRPMVFTGRRGIADFDLAFSEIHIPRITKAWVELIFESPSTGRIVIADMIVLRALRADV
ncbi:MAG: hypothetical protein RLZZ491_2503 [Pseudomonadota bacterium]|jgi:hypothetical protein